MILDIVFLLLGGVLVIKGADWLTDGASAIARRFGLSELIIGMAIIGVGSSLPEFTVSVGAAIRNSPGLAVGNIVGSNIVDILVIVGILALMKPLKVTRTLLNNELPMVVAVCVLVLLFGNSGLLNGNGETMISRVDGVIMLLLLVIFLRMMVMSGKLAAKEGDVLADSSPSEAKPMKTWKIIIAVVIGLGALVGGGDIFVKGATGIAHDFGVSDAMIGLTIVAFGTSLPDIAASVVAARKGQTGLAVGNVIGSVIFNILMALGVASIIRPLTFTGVSQVDLLTMTAAAVLFWLFGRVYKRHTITRIEGAILLIVYVAYTCWLISTAVKG